MSKVQTICPKCGVYNDITDEKCWKCSRLITDEEKQQATQAVSDDHDSKPTPKKTNHQELPAHTTVINNEVVITDIQMPFWSMIVFIFKWTLATIPTVALIWLIVWLATPKTIV